MFGIITPLVAVAFVLFVGWGLVRLVYSGYDQWFGEIPAEEIGTKGLVYNYHRDAIMKTCPNRTVLSHIEKIISYDNDTIGIVVHFGNYGLLNFNSAQFVIPAEYEKMWRVSANSCMAIRNDSLYTINLVDGKILHVEDVGNVYAQISPLYLNRDDYFDSNFQTSTLDEEAVLLYEYTDYQGRKGLMNKNMEKLTPAIYCDITPIRHGVFFCKFYDSYEGDDSLGELLNDKGERITR